MSQEQVPNFERLKDKIIKIYNLASDERGDPVTAQRAREALEKLLKQYNLVIEDIIKPEGKIKRYKFKWNNVQQAKLLKQLYGLVMETNTARWFHNGLDKVYEFKLTEFKFVDLSELYRYYNSYLQKEYNILSEKIIPCQELLRLLNKSGMNWTKTSEGEYLYKEEIQEILGDLLRRRRTLADQIIQKYSLFPPSDGDENDKLPTKEELERWAQLEADSWKLSKMPRHTFLDKTKLISLC